jgi:hypothetical protein
MSTVLLRNTNPLGYVDVPILGRVGEVDDQAGEGCLIPGEVFECPAEIAGEAPKGTPSSGEPGDDDYQPASKDFDLGWGLLAQVGNYELVDDDPLAAMTIDELKDFAAKQDPPIDLTGKTKKAQILRAVKAATA